MRVSVDLPAADEAGRRGGAQIHMPLPTGTGPLTAGTTGLTGAGGADEPGDVDDGPVGTMPGRLWRGWGSAPVAGMGAGERGVVAGGVVVDGGGATVVVGGGVVVDGGGAMVVVVECEGCGGGFDVEVVGLAGGVVGGDALVVGGDALVVGGDALVVGGGGEHAVTTWLPADGAGNGRLPSVTVTSLSLRFVFAAHRQRLQDWAPCPRMVDPLPLTARGAVTTGKPPASGLVPLVVTA